MEAKRIVGATRAMGEGQDEFHTLWIRDDVAPHETTTGEIANFPFMRCCFEPTPDELERLNKGELLYLSILGTGFPPVLITVGDPQPPKE